MTLSDPLLIRPVTADDDLARLTALIHFAYAPHAQRGLRYWGTHQSVEDTAKRFASGTGLVMLDGDDYVGTTTLRPPQPESTVPLYRCTASLRCGRCASSASPPTAKAGATANSCTPMPWTMPARQAPG